MPRRPRLPALAAYSCLLTLALLLYVSSRGPPPEAESASAQLEKTQQEGGDQLPASSKEVLTRNSSKRRGRNKDLPLNPHNFHMIINNPKICGQESAVSLLVQVSSSPGNFYRRRAIRDTWGSSNAFEASHAKLVFLLGNPHDARLQTQIVEESRTFGDVLQEDFVDSYMNLTLKSVMGLKWASTHCPQAQFVMKTDDDMFINVPSLLTYLQEASKSRWITGRKESLKKYRSLEAFFVDGLET